jgi:sec-independent protein translocase protein TatA
MELASIFAFMGLGGPEIALIIFALLLLFGAKKIPELAKGLGKGIREFKDATKDVKSEIEKSMDDRPNTNYDRPYDPSKQA